MITGGAARAGGELGFARDAVETWTTSRSDGRPCRELHGVAGVVSPVAPGGAIERRGGSGRRSCFALLTAAVVRARRDLRAHSAGSCTRCWLSTVFVPLAAAIRRPGVWTAAPYAPASWLTSADTAPLVCVDRVDRYP